MHACRSTLEDPTTYRTYVAALARRLGFSVDTAHDGDRALQRLARGGYDIVVIDYEMRGLTGLDTIARIRAHDELRMLYAIMLTAQDDIEIKLAALDAGFDSVLTKAACEREIVAKFLVARRVASRQRTMNVTIRELYGLATSDDLTGLFNRRFFVSETERLLAEGLCVNVVLLDLDAFKNVNDTLGHLAGDAVLRDIAGALLKITRTHDIVARFGGDEFIIALPDLDVAAVERIAERLRQSITALEWPLYPMLRVSVSAGWASSSLLDAPSLAGLVDAADRDMYKNKWLRNHPGHPPELYEYPEQQRGAVERLLQTADRTVEDLRPRVPRRDFPAV